MLDKMRVYRAVVVAQLVEWLPPTPEICDLNPVIGKFDLPSTVLKTVLKVVPRLWVRHIVLTNVIYLFSMKHHVVS